MRFLMLHSQQSARHALALQFTVHVDPVLHTLGFVATCKQLMKSSVQVCVRQFEQVNVQLILWRESFATFF